jgi:tetratricopeptide (TPR) repeat protein
MSDEWFRRHTWTEADQAEFFARLGRSRTAFHKAQYARIQAYELHQAGGARCARAALELLDMIVQSWMGDAQRASVHHQRAECLRDLERDAEAVEAYREAFAEQRRLPSYLTNAHFNFAWWVAVSGKRELFDEALGVLEEFSCEDGITFPATVYLAEGARALIQHARGDRGAASTHARRALDAAGVKHSGLRYHPTVGLVQGRDEATHAMLTSIAAG